jgi:FSR family fosmidomycin resistance protein-like MFS transporter
MNRHLQISLLGIGHGLSDCLAGFFIGSLPSSDLLDAASLALLYNALAFGGQLPAGMIVDGSLRPKLALNLSLALFCLAALSFPYSASIAVGLAGFGSAFYHVAGGKLALLAFPGSTVGTGLFAAPGVMGLALGGYFAWAGYALLPWLLGGLFIVLVLSLALKLDFSAPEQGEQPAAFDRHDLLMLVLLMAIALRSAVWNLFQLIHADAHELLLLTGLAAMLGKVAGGWLADKMGWRNYAILALSLATPLLAFGGTRPEYLLPGIALLQSATPAAVLGMYRLMPRMGATAVGLCFGLAIAIGALPNIFDWDIQQPLWVIGMGLLAVAGYWFAMRKPRQA